MYVFDVEIPLPNRFECKPPSTVETVGDILNRRGFCLGRLS